MAARLWASTFNPQNQVWRDVKGILPAGEYNERKVFLTARKDINKDQELGRYPRTTSEINKENEWMKLICLESQAPFNLCIFEKTDGTTHVKAVDHICEGEQLTFKYERQKTPFNPNWRCIVRQLDSLALEKCSIINCTCCECKVTDNTNYFLRCQSENLGIPTPQTNTWKKKLKINFKRAEKYRNKIFRRRSRNPFTRNLRQRLWGILKLSSTSGQRSTVANPSGEQVIPDDKQLLHAELNLPSKDSTNEDKSNYTNVSVQIECGLCGKLFKNQRGLKVHHARMHRRELLLKDTNKAAKFKNQKEIRCDNCQKPVKGLIGLKLHNYYCHRNESVPNENRENRGLEMSNLTNTESREPEENTNIDLEIRIKKEIEVCDDDWFLCSHCGEMFGSEEELKIHTEEQNGCQLENSVFSTSEMLNQSPENTSTGCTQEELPIPTGCSQEELPIPAVSNEENSTKSSLNNDKPNLDIDNNDCEVPEINIKDESDVLHYCPICERAFKYELGLKFHIDMHLKDPVTNIFCPFCRACYQSEAQLRQHLKVHVNDMKVK